MINILYIAEVREIKESPFELDIDKDVKVIDERISLKELL